ncbi:MULTISPECIES: hypothetical protein [unclassified Streptomyces]|uniref:hypothetical protein n=1 Tax=unclassified Streptomyces TaxID=2593676 RepID=UPI0003A45491|nr:MULTISPECIES: hypothetical protein [unclassified Streptomyces]MYX36140.1 hypothetical protein [Streptomyces sp. SID8377]
MPASPGRLRRSAPRGAAAEVVEALLAEVPEPQRSGLTGAARHAYAAHAERVHGTRTPPRVGD